MSLINVFNDFIVSMFKECGSGPIEIVIERSPLSELLEQEPWRGHRKYSPTQPSLDELQRAPLEMTLVHPSGSCKIRANQ